MQIANIALFYFIIIWKAQIGMIIMNINIALWNINRNIYLFLAQIEHIEYPTFFNSKNISILPGNALL